MAKTLFIAWIFLSSGILSCKSDRFSFNYHSFSSDQYCTTVSWEYFGESCTPVLFKLQGFNLSDITPNQLGVPRVELNSTSPRFSFPTNYFGDMALLYRSLAVSEEGLVCDLRSLEDYYDFTMLQGSVRTVCLSPQDTSYCIDYSEIFNTDIPLLIWPKSSRSSDGYCFCLVLTNYFPACADSCATIYQFSMQGNSVCLMNTGVVQGHELKVYFVLEATVCSGEHCSLFNTLFSSYKFFQQAVCLANSSTSESPFTNSESSTMIFYNDNYTSTAINGSHPSILRINVTFDSSNNPLAVWRHSGHVIDAANYPRFRFTRNGGLIIDRVMPSDAGIYTVTMSNRMQCESAQFDVFIQYVNISADETSPRTFSCVANGYPEAQLISWQTGSGSNVPEYQFNITSKRQYFYSTTSSTLTIVSQEVCRESWGYKCLFSNGGVSPVIEEGIYHCIPGNPTTPEIIYSNNTVCFSAYSHPDFPFEFSLVNTTLHGIIDTQSCINNYKLESDSNCIVLSNAYDCESECKVLSISVTARNSLGTSAIQTSDILLPDNSLCQNLLQNDFNFIQIRLHDISNCDQWIHINYIDKLDDITNELADYIGMECGCAFPVAHFYLPKFMCFPGSSHHVTFRSAIIKYSNWTASRIIASIENWIAMKDTITFQQETLAIDKECPLLILELEDLECLTQIFPSSYPDPSSNIVIIGGASAGTSFILIILGMLAFIILLCIRLRRKRRINIAQESVYYEVPDQPDANKSDPVYEEIAPNEVNAVRINCIQCEAYAVTKSFSNPNTLRGTVNQEDYQFTECSAYGV